MRSFQCFSFNYDGAPLTYRNDFLIDYIYTSY
jgi:hypothetical protein